MTIERAVLAGGCFWGMQDLIRKKAGVKSTRVGYTGGEVPNATYRNHEGHAEAIEINFDPEVISYRNILAFFFQIHDPTTVDRQGNDVGSSYRSEIFYTTEAQKEMANKEVTGTAGGDIIKLVMNGQHQVKSIRIDHDMIDGDQEMLEDLLVAAFNDAMNKIAELQKDNLGGLTEGLNLPPGFKMPF